MALNKKAIDDMPIVNDFHKHKLEKGMILNFIKCFCFVFIISFIALWLC